MVVGEIACHKPLGQFCRGMAVPYIHHAAPSVAHAQQHPLSQHPSLSLISEGLAAGCRRLDHDAIVVADCVLFKALIQMDARKPDVLIECKQGGPK